MISHCSRSISFNIILTGIDFSGNVAGAMRVKNLLGPLLKQRVIHLHNLIIIAGNNSESVYGKSQNDVKIFVNSYNLVNPFSLIRFVIEGIRYLRHKKTGTCKNILYIYGYPSIENILFVHVARILDYRVVFDIVEDNRVIDSYASSRARIKNGISLFFFSRLGRLAHGCIAISSHLFDICKKMTNGSIPIELIPGSVTTEYFERLFFKPERDKQFVFFYGGNFAEKDGIEIMIRAFERVASMNSHIKLVLTGKGADRHMRTLLHLIENSPAKCQIEYMGFLDRDQYVAQLMRANILLMLRVNSPFANAGFPFKLVEYLASGRPVIASKVGDVEKYLTHNKNAILVEPAAIDQISSAMFYCLEHKLKVRDIGKNGRLVAKEWFDCIKHSRQLFKLFNSI